MSIKLRKPIKLTKRTYNTRTVIRVYLDQTHLDFTAPTRSLKWIKTIPELQLGHQYRYYTQIICNTADETLTSKPNFITPLLTYAG